MFLVDQVILVGALLLLISIVSSKFSSRLGLPVLVLFLLLGMLAGEEGPGGIVFNDAGLAHATGTLALAVILFDGGLRTPLGSVRAAWRPSLVLATFGVVVTSVITGLAASWILDLPLAHGLLLGSIVGSTDAAAVFLILRSRGLNLRPRLAATLEMESGSNDPMAVFLTVVLIEVITGKVEPGADLVLRFLWQMGIGAVVGLVSGRLAVLVINRIRLESPGLYPVLTVACGLFAYGLGAALEASGFLAVYLAGIVLGNHRFVQQRTTLLFHDALAWMSQMTMFVVLGLLCFPSRLASVAGEGVLIGVVLIVVARPISLILALPFRFELKELAFLSLAGPKGAVPIILATYPLLGGVPQASLLFDVVFFVVLVSAVSQGWTMGPAARRLGVQVPEVPEPAVSLEITTLQHIESEIVDYALHPGGWADGRRIRELALPDGVTVALIARGSEVVPPRGSTTLAGHDHVYVVLRPSQRRFVDRVFTPQPALERLPAGVELALKGRVTAGELARVYQIELPVEETRTLADLALEHLGPAPSREASAEVAGVRLRVRDLAHGVPQTVVVTALGARSPEPAPPE